MVTTALNLNSGYHGLVRSKRRRKIIATMTQPSTAAQLAAKTAMTLNGCCESLRQLRSSGHIECLNPQAINGRVYWMTREGMNLQRRFYQERGIPLPERFVPEVDWNLYGRVCSTHRSTVIRTLNEPMQPAQIKRKAYFRDPTIRMSSNNVRDVILFLLKRDVVDRVHRKRAAHPLYQLTTLGMKYQMLLCRARQ